MIAGVAILLLVAIFLMQYGRSLTELKSADAVTDGSTSGTGSLTLQIKTEDAENGGVQPFVSAYLNNEEVFFLLDTGGESSMLPENFKDKVRIVNESEATDSNGKRVMYQTSPIDFRLGGVTINKVCFSIPGPYLQLTHNRRVWNCGDKTPVLGQNILSRYRVVIDGTKKEFHLLQDSDLPQNNEWVSYIRPYTTGA
ncbi:MAG: hypothetical protein V1899_00745 [Planctomycetota bacterium]